MVASITAFLVIAVIALPGIRILEFFSTLANPIARILGQTGINVLTRLMGLILAAQAGEVMADGLGKLVPILGRPAS